jgi:ankyrin repeat protein
LSVLAGDKRHEKMNAVDSNLRSPAMFAAFYSNSDAIELLAASDANLMLIDKNGRFCLHYATLVDNAKVLQTIFLSCKGTQ